MLNKIIKIINELPKESNLLYKPLNEHDETCRLYKVDGKKCCLYADIIDIPDYDNTYVVYKYNEKSRVTETQTFSEGEEEKILKYIGVKECERNN